MRGFLLAVTYALFIATISFAAIISNRSLPESSTADALPSRELTIPNGPILQSGNSGLGAKDPRFFTLVKDGDEDLPDKSVFMNILAVLRELSRQQFNDHFHGGEWSIHGYDNVAVHIPPHPRLRVNYAMWGLNHGVAHMNGNGYQSVEVHMFLNGGRGVGPVEVGIIRILKSNRVNRKPETDPAPLPHRAQLAANATSFRNTSGVDEDNVSSLDTPNYNLRPNFQGPRISTYGVLRRYSPPSPKWRAGIVQGQSKPRGRPLEVPPMSP
ncbi:MAG: hypothetical protein Q9198_006996 [Flavoplaca austrocitrina]